MPVTEKTRWENAKGSIAVRRPAPSVVVLTVTGHDVGAFGEAPFRAVSRELDGGAGVELFIDAREAKSASLDVSGAWAQWLDSRRLALRRVNMLTGSRFVQLTAEFVQNFAGLGDLMRIYTNAADFDVELAVSVANALRERRD